VAGGRLQVPGYRFQVSGFRFQVPGYRNASSDCLLVQQALVVIESTS
jgi:hypothetical protein